jgi:hypothetical protein
MTSKYFSIGSVRPGLSTTVPRGCSAVRCDGFQTAARSRMPPAPRYHSPLPPGGEDAPGTPIRGALAAKAWARFTRAS